MYYTVKKRKPYVRMIVEQAGFAYLYPIFKCTIAENNINISNKELLLKSYQAKISVGA